MNRALPGVILVGLLGMAVFSCSSRAADQPVKDVLVGINYFAGWWEPLPNKWHDPLDGSDWRPKFPGRVPLLGEFNTQATMDKFTQPA